MKKGYVEGISGHIVQSSFKDVKIGERVYVGEKNLAGEVVRILKEGCLIMVFEDTRDVKLKEEIIFTDKEPNVLLGPGLLGGIYDGLQRQLSFLMERYGSFIKPMKNLLDINLGEYKLNFVPLKKSGERVFKGEAVGYVIEKGFKIFIFSHREGFLKEIKEGKIDVEKEVALLKGGEAIRFHHSWSLKEKRPYKKKRKPEKILLTGQRVIDFLFPIPLGGTFIIPGGFGTGKTILQQTIAKFAQADIVIYVGCGERGNEMAELLEEFSEIKDPWENRPLMDRTIIVVNTSNMPVAAREASIYTGVTIAEFYRDCGLNVLLIVDSISRWAEALREISSSLEEMPGDEGYPTYLISKLSDFFERAGLFDTLNNTLGSITMLISVSPPGGDTTEPVTQSCLRTAGGLLMLDKELASRRFFPAINHKLSYSLYERDLQRALKDIFGENYQELKSFIMTLLNEEEKLREILDIIGYESLQDRDRLIIDTAELLKDKFLSQNAFSHDAFSTPKEMVEKVELIKRKYREAQELLETGNPYFEVRRVYESF